jgi:tetratricopeptide (TPR) repeat protein
VFWRRRPKDRNELVALADRARARGRLKQAVEGYRKALTLAPGDLAIHAKLAPVLARRGQKAEAIQSFALAATGQLQAGFADRAVSLRRQAAETFPEELPLWEELSRLHLARGRRADAVATLLAGGHRLRRSQRPDVGVKVLRLVLEIEPGHVEGATLRRSRRLAFRLSPTPRRAWRWFKAVLGRR